jgi:hypothetical protein
MGSSKTIVKGIRASQEFFDKCDLVAKAEGIDRNKLIVRVVSEYCDNIIDYSKEVVEHHKMLIKEITSIAVDIAKENENVKNKR